MCSSTVQQLVLLLAVPATSLQPLRLLLDITGLKQNYWYRCALHRTAQEGTQKHSHLQRVHAHDNVPDDKVTYTTRCVNAHIFESSQLESSRFVCRALTIFMSLWSYSYICFYYAHHSSAYLLLAGPLVIPKNFWRFRFLCFHLLLKDDKRGISCEKQESTKTPRNYLFLSSFITIIKFLIIHLFLKLSKENYAIK